MSCQHSRENLQPVHAHDGLQFFHTGVFCSGEGVERDAEASQEDGNLSERVMAD